MSQNKKIQERLCEECDKPISPKRLELVPSATCCVQCQSKNDVFKYKMKTVGFDDEPTIAKSKDDWKKLEKQTVLKDV